MIADGNSFYKSFPYSIYLFFPFKSNDPYRPFDMKTHLFSLIKISFAGKTSFTAR